MGFRRKEFVAICATFIFFINTSTLKWGFSDLNQPDALNCVNLFNPRNAWISNVDLLSIDVSNNITHEVDRISILGMLRYRDSCAKMYQEQYPQVNRAVEKGFMKSALDYWRLKGSSIGFSYPCIQLSISADQCYRDYRADIRDVPPNEIHSPARNSSCKMLWFSALYEGASPKYISQDGKIKNRYIEDYMVALLSAKTHAQQTLIPVLIIGRYKLENENSTTLSAFGKWAKSHGAIVYHVGKLSFQDDLDYGWENLTRGEFPAAMMGTYLRFEIPNAVDSLDLFNLPGVCGRHVLYTDSDILFVNKISQSDVAHLRNVLSSSDDHFIMYGPERNINDPFSNVGVLALDVPKFKQIWPTMRQFASNRAGYPQDDQDWINTFIEETNRTHTRAYLPPLWNWKLYWSIEPYFWQDVKIIHTHGPKMGAGVENMILMNPNLPYYSGEIHRETYNQFVVAAIACNGGETAARYADMYYKLLPSEDVLREVSDEGQFKTDPDYDTVSVRDFTSRTCKYIYHINIPTTDGYLLQKSLSNLRNYKDIAGNFYTSKGMNIKQSFEQLDSDSMQTVVSAEIGIGDLRKQEFPYFNDTCFFALIEDPYIWIVNAERSMRQGSNYKDGFGGTWGYFDQPNIQSNMVGFDMDISSLNHNIICVYTQGSIEKALDFMHTRVPENWKKMEKESANIQNRSEYAEIVKEKYGKDIELWNLVKDSKTSSICWYKHD